MQIVKIIVFLILFSQLLSACKQINESEKKSVSILFDETLKIDSITQLKNHKLLYVFNGNCSLCILKLNELQDLLDSKKNDVAMIPIFIATQADPDILAYCLEKINFKYPVVFDSLNLLQTKNNELNIENNSFFVLDSNNAILARSHSLPKLY